MKRALTRLQKVQSKREAETKRENLLMTESKLEIAERDPMRLLRETKAVERAKVRIEDLDAAETRRVISGAHSQKIPLGGYDLKFSGRSKPSWSRAAGF